MPSSTNKHDTPQRQAERKGRIIVQKYGGATVETPEKIRQVAARIAELSKSGTQVVAAVSAMGKTTNQLIDLANQVSAHPNRRELDMLLTTGERVTMALVSMALHDLGCQAISFTGSQAGILTDDSHVNAKIIDVKAFRVEEALAQSKVVVLAGFQGVNPATKEITTLGRGGTDTTAVAMAAYLGADRCEILKDVAGVFTADPKLVPSAKPLPIVSYQQMMEMTFWGAKVLHHRSVELAQQKKVPLYVGPASQTLSDGTLIKELPMFESSKVMALNSHEQVLLLKVKTSSMNEAYQILHQDFEKFEISFPQVLSMEVQASDTVVFITGPAETLHAILKERDKLKNVSLLNTELSSVSATCTGVASPEIAHQVLAKLAKTNITPAAMNLSAQSINLFIDAKNRKAALSSLHELI